MATGVHQSDVVELATALLGVGTPEGTIAYRQGQPFFDLLQSDDEFDEITIDISGRTRNLRETLAALEAVQLAFDAAAAAVEYRIRYDGDDDDDKKSIRNRLRELRADPVWELQVVELGAGSFRAKLKAFVSSPSARTKALAVAGLLASVVTAFFDPIAGIPGIVISVLGVANEFFPPRPPKEALSERLASEQAEEKKVTGADFPDWDQAQRASFEAGFDKLTQYMERQRLESLAREDALHAEVRELKVVVEKLQQKPSGKRV